MPVTTIHTDAILFDMDGTLLDSTPGVIGAWELFKEKYPNIDVQSILSSSFGIRTVDNLKKYCGIEDPDVLIKEAERFEMAILATSTQQGRHGIVQLPGVPAIIRELASRSHLPNPSWAICTSAARDYASSALRVAGIPVPDVFVTAGDVTRGKPSPEPYLLGAELCGLDPVNCVVIEDAPSGLRSGRGAGCTTIGLLTTHSREALEVCQPDFLVKDLSRLCITQKDRGLEITINTD